MSQLSIQTVTSQLFAENAYVVHLAGSRECIVVDPGLEPEAILQAMEAANIEPQAILNTHGHSDHIAGNEAIKRRWPDCRVVIGEKDADKLTDPAKNLSGDFGVPLAVSPADRTVSEGDTVNFAGIELEVFDTPGHSAGHVTFLYRGASPGTAFVGDVIFQGSMGRTDFFDGSTQQLYDSIHNKLFTLPEETVLLPGHGPPTTVGEEKRHNPFVGERSPGWRG